MIPAIYMLIQFNQVMPYLLSIVGVYVIVNLLMAAYKEDQSGDEAVPGVRIWLQNGCYDYNICLI